MDKKMIDDAIGFEIPEELYENAVISARKKLQSLIQRFGDCDGVRRTPGYLAELVIEAIKSELLTKYTLTMAIADQAHEN